MNRSHFLPFLVLACWLTAPHLPAQDLATSFKTKVKPLLENHCIDCHGPTQQKANLRLDNLQPDLRDERMLAVWTTVHDKLAAGEMPPRKRDRPPQAELQAALTWLQRELHAGSLERQQKQGRVVVRRLNGTEYENTVR